MTTECTTERLEFGGLRRQRVVGRFDGGELGSDGGGLLLRELAQRTGLFGRLSACFRDYREPQRTRHPVEVLVAARVLGLALGYEDLNDHDTLRQSKLWSLLCGVAGRGGRKASWQELPPGKSTLNRMELTGPALEAGERYKKIVADTARLDALLVDLFLDWHGSQPERIVLDVDATAGTVEELARIVGRIRQRWPGVEIWLRGDSGFCREELMAWCEAQGVEYVLGIAQNPRLKQRLAAELEQARQVCERTGQAARAAVYTQLGLGKWVPAVPLLGHVRTTPDSLHALGSRNPGTCQGADGGRSWPAACRPCALWTPPATSDCPHPGITTAAAARAVLAAPCRHPAACPHGPTSCTDWNLSRSPTRPSAGSGTS